MLVLGDNDWGWHVKIVLVLTFQLCFFIYRGRLVRGAASTVRSGQLLLLSLFKWFHI
jgi:hypothetical protein